MRTFLVEYFEVRALDSPYGEIEKRKLEMLGG